MKMIAFDRKTSKKLQQNNIKFDIRQKKSEEITFYSLLSDKFACAITIT